MQQPTALWHLSDKHSEIRQIQSVLSIQGDCDIKTLYSLVSTGTERIVACGLVPENLHQSMRVPYMEGSFSFPVKYGYSLVGEVVNGPENLKRKIVHLLHPHQDYCTVLAEDVFVVPGDVPAPRATLASNLETALNALWDSGVSAGDKVLVVGFGLIGSLVTRLLTLLPAVQVVVVEVNPNRIQSANMMGFRTAGPEELDADFDLAFHCSSQEAGLQTCVDKTGVEGKIIELSWYGNKGITLHLGGTFHSQRKSIISSQVSSIPASKQARWNFYRRKEVVFELLKNPAFDQHITTVLPFSQLPGLFEKIRKGKAEALSYGINYEKILNS